MHSYIALAYSCCFGLLKTAQFRVDVAMPLWFDKAVGRVTVGSVCKERWILFLSMTFQIAVKAVAM